MAFQADGPLVSVGQIYVGSLDAAPREEDVITGVASIDTGELTADEIAVANLVLSGQLTSTGDMLMTGLSNIARISSSRVGIGTDNSVYEFMVGDNKVIIDRNLQNIVTVDGNVASTSLIATDFIRTFNNKFIVDNDGSNVLQVVGNTHSTNLIADTFLTVGPNSGVNANVAQFQNGNVHIDNGHLFVTGNLYIAGNVSITDDLTYKNSNNLVVSNAVIQMADGVPGGVYDNALIMTDFPGQKSNIAVGYSVSNTEIFFSRTWESAYTVGSVTVGQRVPLISDSVNVHVYGKLYTESNVGVANIEPTHTMCIGSNIFFEETGSNVMHATGNIYVEKLNLGNGGITTTNDLLTIDENNLEAPITFGGNVQTISVRTTGSRTSGISNTSPTDTLSVGTKIFANITNSNTLVIHGNTFTTNIETRSLYSSSSIVIHADQTGGDSTSNVLTLKSGPANSNTSSIIISGANNTPTNQLITFKTKNAERMRIQSSGKIGISNTNPDEKLTINGNIHVMGQSGLIVGNVWGSKGMRIYSKPQVGENRIENIVESGKGLNFHVNQTSTMGTAKMTILETSNVGIGTTQPQSLLQTSGGSVFVNPQVVRRNNYNHLNTPAVINQPIGTSILNETSNVLQLTREGTGSKQGVRAAFKMGKWLLEDNKSHTRLDIDLAHEDYAVDTNIITIRSDGKVGIGHTNPEAFLEVKCEGIRSPGMVVHNHDDGDAIIEAKTDLAQGNAFSAYKNGNGGWSAGITGLEGDYRIVNNPLDVSASASTSLYVSGSSSNVGIGTDITRGDVELNGNVVIGNKLTFGGLAGAEFGNTQFIERRYGINQAKNELVLYKGSAGSGNRGKTRIRHIAAEHLFQTYDDATFNLTSEIGLGENDLSEIPLRVTASGAVIIGGNQTIEPADPANKLVIAGNIEFAAGGQFRVTGIEFETTEPIGSASTNIIRCVSSAAGRRPLRFLHEISDGNDFEFARFDAKGHLGIGTQVTGNSNVHIHNPLTSDQDVLKLTSNSASSGVSKTGILLYLSDRDGGYIRGYHDVDNDKTGLVLGSIKNGSETDDIYINNTGQVGIGTTDPVEKLHIYNGEIRIDNSTTGTFIELNTPGGTSNILADVDGNVFINPASTETTIASNLVIENDLTVLGNIDLGEAVAIGLGGETSNTQLQVAGGMITGSDQVFNKRYSTKFNRSSINSHDIRFIFTNGNFYAKIIGILRETSSGATENISTMILEISGGSSDPSVRPTKNIYVGNKSIFGNTNFYPWSRIVTTGKNGIVISPSTGANDGSRNYSYDFQIEIVSAFDCKLESIRTANRLDVPDTGVPGIPGSSTEIVGSNPGTNVTGQTFGY